MERSTKRTIAGTPTPVWSPTIVPSDARPARGRPCEGRPGHLGHGLDLGRGRPEAIGVKALLGNGGSPGLASRYRNAVRPGKHHRGLDGYPSNGRPAGRGRAANRRGLMTSEKHRAWMDLRGAVLTVPIMLRVALRSPDDRSEAVGVARVARQLYADAVKELGEIEAEDLVGATLRY